MSSDKLLLVLRLTVVFMFAVIEGIDLSFNVYAVLLKETFNFTQTQVEMTASMNSIGLGLAFIEPILITAFGYWTTFVVTWVAFPLSCGLFSLAAVYGDFSNHWPVIVYMAQLVMNASSNTAFMVVMRTVLEIVPEGFTGTFIGMFGSAVCFGKIFLAGLFDLFFYNDLAGFFGCLAVLIAVILGVCYILIYPIAMTLERKSQREREEIECDGIVSEMLRSRFFHMTFWSVTIFVGVTNTVLNNITSVTDSLGIRDPFNTVTIMSVCIMATRLVFGFIYDKLSSLSCGFILLFIGYLNVTAALFICMDYLDINTIYYATVLSGIGVGTAMYLPLAIFVNHFGRKSYRFISSSFFAVTAVILLIFQLTTGFMYDSKIVQNGTLGNFCYGPSCFYSSFVLLFVVTLLVMVTQAVNFSMTKWCHRS